jgi:BASS family bile acid:Na+ symporter
MLSDLLQLGTQAGMLVFVVGSMAAVGLGLTVGRIVEPLRDARLVLSLIVANFVVVPAVAVAATRLLPIEPAAATAVVLIGCVAGAPFLPRLAQLARGDVALGVGGMVLLMVLTVGYAPLVVPLVVPGAAVDAIQIAASLVVLMLLPLGLGLLVRARREAFAGVWVGRAGRASTIGLVFGAACAILVTWRDMLGAVGTGIFVGMAVVLAAGLAAGWLAAMGRGAGDRVVGALATAQRNIAAAVVVAAPMGGDALVYTLVGALVVPLVLIVLAGGLGRRARPGPPPAGT